MGAKELAAALEENTTLTTLDLTRECSGALPTPRHCTAALRRVRGALCCAPPQRFAARANGIRACAPIAAGNVNVSLATLTLIMSMLRNNMLSAIPYVRFAFACGHLTSPLFLIRHATQPYPALSLAHASPTVVCVAAPYTQPLPVPPPPPPSPHPPHPHIVFSK